MKKNNLEIEKYRLTKLNSNRYNKHLQSTSYYGNNGVFIIPYANVKLFCVVSDKLGWDHLSVHVVQRRNKERIPKWCEMCLLKNLFWDESETVVQFHPKKNEYINCHPYTLHMWKNQNHEHELPPQIMV